MKENNVILLNIEVSLDNVDKLLVWYMRWDCDYFSILGVDSEININLFVIWWLIDK
jgi:hypothetical protein